MISTILCVSRLNNITYHINRSKCRLLQIHVDLVCRSKTKSHQASSSDSKLWLCAYTFLGVYYHSGFRSQHPSEAGRFIRQSLDPQKMVGTEPRMKTIDWELACPGNTKFNGKMNLTSLVSDWSPKTSVRHHIRSLEDMAWLRKQPVKVSSWATWKWCQDSKDLESGETCSPEIHAQRLPSPASLKIPTLNQCRVANDGNFTPLNLKILEPLCSVLTVSSIHHLPGYLIWINKMFQW